MKNNKLLANNMLDIRGIFSVFLGNVRMNDLKRKEGKNWMFLPILDLESTKLTNDPTKLFLEFTYQFSKISLMAISL